MVMLQNVRFNEKQSALFFPSSLNLLISKSSVLTDNIHIEVCKPVKSDRYMILFLNGKIIAHGFALFFHNMNCKL